MKTNQSDYNIFVYTLRDTKCLMITKAPFFFWGTYIYLCIFEWLSQLHIKRTKNNLLKIDVLINWIAENSLDFHF